MSYHQTGLEKCCECVGELQSQISVARMIENSFWAARKRLNLETVNVQDPGQDITDYIARLQATLEAMKVEVERHRKDPKHFHGYTRMKKRIDSLEAQLEAMKGENGVLLEAIERYGEHTDHCVFTMQHRGPQEPISCCCGFDDALKRTPSTYRKRGEALREAIKFYLDHYECDYQTRVWHMKKGLDCTKALHNLQEALALLTESEGGV